MNIDERLERMASAADVANAEYHHRMSTARTPTEAVLMAAMAGLFLELSGVLRAGIDPQQRNSQEKTDG